ncbi:hypothetical protein CI238_00450 [Colletotrichum incanum]|uniref:Uncharacterized protein n=1 Tax=Colletotrichum incanum TaxID=1573173 RepID=A0A167BH82_COLIC|nr:hypothetical protein CI238_00450 [Colletotrichum incanum]
MSDPADPLRCPESSVSSCITIQKGIEPIFGSTTAAFTDFKSPPRIYAERREAAGNLPVSTPTPESVVSLHTVTALLPYEDQFQAAGLAVTSAQQRQRSPPKMFPVKEPTPIAATDDKLLILTESYTKEPQRKGKPGHLQLNGLRSLSMSSTDTSSSGTQVAFTQPDAWELAFIDEVPAKKDRSNCCNFPCFPNTRDQSADVPASRAPPVPTPTTIDTPKKIFAKWEPVYPQRTEGLQGWRKSDSSLGHLLSDNREGEHNSRDARAKTWHGNTAQRPSTYRKTREAVPPLDEVEPPSPRNKHLKKTTRNPEEQEKPPIPPRAEARPKVSRKHSESPIESSALKGLRKKSQLDVFTGREDVTTAGSPSKIVAKKPTKAVTMFVSDENTPPMQLNISPIQPEPKESRGTVKKPLRVSTRQPERKAKEKDLQQSTQAGIELLPIFQSGRVFRGLPGPLKITGAEHKERSAVTSHGTVRSNVDLPSTWKLTLSTSSSLEAAMEAATQEMEKKESKLPECERIMKQYLTEQPQPTAAREDKHDVPLPSPISKENGPELEKQPVQTRETFRDDDGSVPKGQDDRNINDRDVLRGLSIAISAACDEEVDTWIRQKTGVRIRRFLADLKAFETLGDEDEPDPVKERARKRRADSRKLKAQIRQSKAAREARAQ